MTRNASRMEFLMSWPSLRRVIAIFCSSLIFLFGLWMLAEDKKQRMLTSNAAAISANWATEMTRTIPDLSILALTGQVSREAVRAIERNKLIGGVHRFKVFDRNGYLKFDTQTFDPRQLFGGSMLGYHNADAAEIVAAGGMHQLVAVAQINGEERRLVETYLPLSVDGIRLGTVEVHVDVTKTAEVLRQELQVSALILVVIAAVGCWLPLGAYVVQKLRTERFANALADAASIDPLTGLPNRRALLLRLEQATQDRSPDAQGLQLDLINLDNFKAINDHHGAEAGDAILKGIGIGLGQLCNSGAEIFRMSADEYAILTKQPARCDIAPGVIHQSVGHPQKIKGQNATVSMRCSSGSARWPEDAADAAELLAHAEIARFMAKLQGRNCHVNYEPSLKEAHLQTLALESTVRRALEQDVFALHFQPFFSRGGVSLAGFEALLRMNDEDGNPVSPGDFVPVLEETGLIKKVGLWVLEESCRIAAEWPGRLRIAVNLSQRQFEDGDLPVIVAHALAQSGLSPKRLELEITESLILNHDSDIEDQLNEIRKMGVSIAIDDFGTGYSSLGQLWRFPIDKLKIDRSFITGLEDGSGKAFEIVKSVVGLGRSLDMKITVEGIETEDQASILKRLGVQYQQGFLHGRPVPPTQANAMVLRSIAQSSRQRSSKHRAAKRRQPKATAVA
jgi:diguanylate cyclase (GGDEF)-like protein